MAGFPALIKAKYATLANRWTALQQQASSAALLRSTFHGDLARSSLWRYVLSRCGSDGAASAVFTDQSGCRGFRDLWRDDNRGNAFLPARGSRLEAGCLLRSGCRVRLLVGVGA